MYLWHEVVEMYLHTRDLSLRVNYKKWRCVLRSLRLTCRDSAGASVAVPEARGDGQLALLADAHAGQALSTANKTILSI